MGKFIGVVAAALNRQGDHFIQATEVIEFLDVTWVYYCRPHMGRPRPGWADVAAGTLRLSMQQPPFRHDTMEWQPRVTREAAGVYHYQAEVFGVEPGNNLFHLALPPSHVPVAGSWDIPPLYGHADGRRFVVGWGGYEMIWPAFRFTAVEAQAFVPQAEAIGETIAQAARERATTVMNPWVPAQEGLPSPAELLRKLNEHLNEEETRTLVFELGVDYDNLAGGTKSAKLRELILFMERQSQMPHFMEFLQRRYPYILRD